MALPFEETDLLLLFSHQWRWLKRWPRCYSSRLPLYMTSSGPLGRTAHW